MAKTKITVTMDIGILKKLDGMVESKIFHNRNEVIQKAVDEKLSRMVKNRLARECAKLDAKFEQALAEGILSGRSEA